MVRAFMKKRLPDGWYKKGVAPNGVYILTINDYLVERRVWSKSDNPKAVGVALLTDNCRFVISKNQASEVAWGGDGITISDITTTTNMIVAKKDYAGKQNTAGVVAQLGSVASAAAYCNSCVFLNNKHGYLGSCGEWTEASNNKGEIDVCMSLIGGAAINTSGYYWTSTQYSSIIAWAFYFRGGGGRGATTYGKYFNYDVRAFAPL